MSHFLHPKHCDTVNINNANIQRLLLFVKFVSISVLLYILILGSDIISHMYILIQNEKEMKCRCVK